MVFPLARCREKNCQSAAKSVGNCFVGQQPSKLQVADQELKVDANGVGMQSRHALVPRAAATL